MKLLLAILVVLAIGLAILSLVIRSKRGRTDRPWPYFAKKPLTVPEQILYFRLLKALPDQIVLAQVQLSRMLGVKKGSDYQRWFNRINQMSADFVICTKDATIVAVIELDDSSHRNDRRRTTDEKKGRALGAAGIKVVRWHVQELPDSAAIRSTVLTDVSVNPESQLTALVRHPTDAD
jgi:very-short-patch-repair endonuclease